MNKISALAIALSVALGSSFAIAPMADAATTANKPAAACAATKAKPCPVKHVAHKKPMHHKVAVKKHVGKKADAAMPAKGDKKAVNKS
ncbi:MAG: hypothetical protein JWM58_2589 [Rhizobium sp.]|nr:hypothetical protein [Rhizobium sp.]